MTLNELGLIQEVLVLDCSIQLGTRAGDAPVELPKSCLIVLVSLHNTVVPTHPPPFEKMKLEPPSCRKDVLPELQLLMVVSAIYRPSAICGQT